MPSQESYSIQPLSFHLKLRPSKINFALLLLTLLRTLIAISLAAIISSPLLINLGTLVDYGFQYNYYVNVLCENQDKPDIQCNGKCQFALQAPENEEPAKPLPPGTEIFETVVALDEEPGIVMSTEWFADKEERYLSNNVNLPSDIFFIIPTPPPEVVI